MFLLLAGVTPICYNIRRRVYPTVLRIYLFLCLDGKKRRNNLISVEAALSKLGLDPEELNRRIELNRPDFPEYRGRHN